ncbi:MAG: spermidine synthase [Gammaproteobacteria bacterium]
MSRLFEELSFRETRLGELSLRRRLCTLTHKDIYEVKLNDEFLMSSLFTHAEEELALLGLAAVKENELDVLVGGLGLGYTAAAALTDSRVRSLNVIETMSDVIDWHQQWLVPLGQQLSEDQRCQFIEADFFTWARQEKSLTAELPGDLYHAILLDIDHSTQHWLNDDHAGFYSVEGLQKMQSHLQPGGVFAMWSNDPPDDDFVMILKDVFCNVDAHIIRFPNPYQSRDATATVYVAR